MVILPAPAAVQRAFQGPLLAPRQNRKADTNGVCHTTWIQFAIKFDYHPLQSDPPTEV